MTSEDIEEMYDKDQMYYRYFDGMQRRFLKTLVSDEVIEEHRASPLGQHSEPLERLLIYFRRAPQAGKYAIKRDQMTDKFTVVMFSGVRGEPPTTVGDAEYDTVEEAYHAVFLMRVRDLTDS